MSFHEANGSQPEETVDVKKSVNEKKKEFVEKYVNEAYLTNTLLDDLRPSGDKQKAWDVLKGFVEQKVKDGSWKKKEGMMMMTPSGVIMRDVYYLKTPVGNIPVLTFDDETETVTWAADKLPTNAKELSELARASRVREEGSQVEKEKSYAEQLLDGLNKIVN